MNDEEIREREKDYEFLERRYHWGITTLVGIICLLLGMLVQAERMTERMVAQEVKSEALEKRLVSIETKLDRILDGRRAAVNGD